MIVKIIPPAKGVAFKWNFLFLSGLSKIEWKNNNLSNFITKNKLTRNKLYKYLEVNNIQPNFHYIPVYRHPYFQNLNFKKNYCREAEIFFKTAITIPLHNKLTIKQQKFIINIVKKLVI